MIRVHLHFILVSLFGQGTQVTYPVLLLLVESVESSHLELHLTQHVYKAAPLTPTRVHFLISTHYIYAIDFVCFYYDRIIRLTQP